MLCKCHCNSYLFIIIVSTRNKVYIVGVCVHGSFELHVQYNENKITVTMKSFATQCGSTCRVVFTSDIQAFDYDHLF